MSSRKSGNQIPSNEIRVTATGDLGGYVKYALKCFRDNERTLTLKGTGTATSKVLHLTEILKRRVGDLYQSNNIYSIVVDDVREGNKHDDGKRRMSVLECVLSTSPLDKEGVGYQDPVPREDQQAHHHHPRRFGQGHYPHRGHYYGGYNKHWNRWGGQRNNFNGGYRPFYGKIF